MMSSRVFHGSLVVYMYLYFFYVICIFIHPPSLNMVHGNFLDALFFGGGKFLTTWNMVSVVEPARVWVWFIAILYFVKTNQL